MVKTAFEKIIKQKLINKEIIDWFKNRDFFTEN